MPPLAVAQPKTTKFMNSLYKDENFLLEKEYVVSMSILVDPLPTLVQRRF